MKLFFLYFIYIIFTFLIIYSLYLIVTKEVKLKDLTLENINRFTPNGMMGIVVLLVSISGILWFYHFYGF